MLWGEIQGGWLFSSAKSQSRTFWFRKGRHHTLSNPTPHSEKGEEGEKVSKWVPSEEREEERKIERESEMMEGKDWGRKVKCSFRLNHGSFWVIAWERGSHAGFYKKEQRNILEKQSGPHYMEAGEVLMKKHQWGAICREQIVRVVMEMAKTTLPRLL